MITTPVSIRKKTKQNKNSRRMSWIFSTRPFISPLFCSPRPPLGTAPLDSPSASDWIQRQRGTGGQGARRTPPVLLIPPQTGYLQPPPSGLSSHNVVHSCSCPPHLATASSLSRSRPRYGNGFQLLLSPRLPQPCCSPYYCSNLCEQFLH